jgi:pimeloyl-ACP methyl ester carboxylesterase
MSRVRWISLGLATAVAAIVAGAAGGAENRTAATVGTSFPAGFPTIADASLGTPVLGFGAAGRVKRTPVIFLHGNNDTPFPTLCNPAGKTLELAQAFVDRGYAPSEVWGLGYQGDQCDLAASPTNRSAAAHTTAANVDDLARFVKAVRKYTGAKRVDIVGHSLGGTLAREWMRRDNAYKLVRRLVTIASPHHGIIDCSPSPLNYFALDALGGFNPNSAICVELGAAGTPFLTRLNRQETPGPTKYLALRNADADFVYISAQDGPFFPAVPAQDRNGNPHDFSASPALSGRRAANVALTGQGAYDAFGSAHLGILPSPQTEQLAYGFLAGERDDDDDDHDD